VPKRKPSDQFNLAHYTDDARPRPGGTANERPMLDVLQQELLKHWPDQQFTVGTQVRLDPGNTRQLDFVVMRQARIGPAEYHGFDAKSSRNDILRELGDARKLTAYEDAVNFLWVLADSLDILDLELLSHAAWRQHGFGLAVRHRNRIYTIHTPRARNLDATWYLVHENARLRSLGRVQRADLTGLTQTFRETEWFEPVPDAVHRRIKRLRR